MTPDHLAPSLDLRVLAEGLDHVEGICWDPTRRCLWAGGEAGQIYRIELDGTYVVEEVITWGVLLGIALDTEGALYLCDVGNHTVWSWSPGGVPTRYGDEINYPNYPAFGPDGTLYVSDSGSFREATGSLIAIDRSGTSTRLDVAPVAFANGLAVRDGYLYFVASALPGVWRVALDGGDSELVTTMERCVPDGLAFDEAGSLYISCYQPNQLWRLTPAGELTCLFDDWTGEFILSPTNLAFYGDELDRVALASLCGHAVTTVTVGVAGAPVGPTRRPAT